MSRVCYREWHDGTDARTDAREGVEYMTVTVTDTTIAAAAALLADPTRAGFVVALSDGRALPAGELARRGRVAPSTATAHLTKLVAQGFLVVEAQGRRRYYRLANPAVVRALEALAAVACPTPIRSLQASEEAAALHSARTCYDHLAGALGVALTQALVDGDVLDTVADGYTVTTRGAVVLKGFGLDLDGVRRRPRLFAPRCLDWSERQHHVAGALGAALAGRLFELGWIARVPANRAVRVTTDGREGLRERFDLDLMAAPWRAETE